MNNNIVIYHHDDMDGKSSAAYVALQLMKGFSMHDLSNADIKFIEYNYNDPEIFDQGNSNDIVFIVDLSFTPKTVSYLEKLCSRVKYVYWIDHHDISEQTVPIIKSRTIHNLIYDVHTKDESDNKISAAYLCWCVFNYYGNKIEDLFKPINEPLIIPNYLTNILCPMSIRFISDYDTFNHNLNDEYDSDIFKIGMDSIDQDPSSQLYWYDIFNDKYSNIYEKGKIIKGYIDQWNKSYRERFMYETLIEGYRAVVINCSTNSWIFGDEYYTHDIVCIFVFDGSQYKYSLFSCNPEVDCASIAYSYGGGGHRGAAGFRSDKLLFKIRNDSKILTLD